MSMAETPTATTQALVTDRIGLLVRAALVSAAAVLAFLGAPSLVATVVTAVAVVAVAERAARLRRRGLVDTVLVTVGGVLVMAAMLGLVLNYLPGHLGRHSWAIGAGGAGLVALAVCAALPWTPTPLLAVRRRPSMVTATTTVAAVLVLGAAVVLSVRSFESTTVDPLQLAAPGSVQGGQAQVVLSSQASVGPLDLVVFDGDATTVLAAGFTVPAGGSLSEVVPVPDGRRVLVQLRYPGQRTPLRSLILDGAGAR